MTHPIMPPRPLVANTTGLGTAGGCGDGVLIFGAIMEDDAVANKYCYSFYWLWSNELDWRIEADKDRWWRVE